MKLTLTNAELKLLLNRRAINHGRIYHEVLDLIGRIRDLDLQGDLPEETTFEVREDGLYYNNMKAYEDA